MEDNLTVTMSEAEAQRQGVVKDFVTLFKDEPDRGWAPLGDLRVSDGLWDLLRRRRDEPSCDDGDPTEPAEKASGHRYLVGREIGRGGMGIVFEGWDAQLQRRVAIKIMDGKQQGRPAGLRWFFREARLASQLQHPGIVAIHEFDMTAAGQAFIVMQLLTGQTLKHILADRQHGDADLPGLLAIFLQVCQAVAAAHGAGVIHRDLKPSNIMVGQFGVVTVMDWGVAKVLGQTDDDGDDRPDTETLPTAVSGRETVVHLTAAGTVCGTPAYLAPEQARGEIDRIDRRADVFGLGGILCELLTGKAPFAADDAEASWAKAVAGDLADAFARLDACTAPFLLVTLAKRCLAADAAARPDSAAAIVTELTDYLEAGQRRAEQELVRFFDLSLDLFGIAGLNGYFRRLNENFPRLLGYSVDELKSQQFMDFVHPDDREKTTAELGRLSRGEPTIQFVNRYRHADGHYVWLEWNARSVAEEAAIYAVARDVSERVTAAQERSTLAAFTAASALFLTAEGTLRKRLDDVTSEAVSQLDIAAVQVWGWDDRSRRLTLLTSSGVEVGADGASGGIAAGEGPIGTVALNKQPWHVVDTHDDWRDFDRDRMVPHGIRSFVGYPLLVADQLVGVLAVYSVRPVSDLLITALSSVVASMALAIRLDRREG